MNHELLTLIRKLREVDTPDDIAAVRALGETYLRREKHEALLTLLAIYEEIRRERNFRRI